MNNWAVGLSTGCFYKTPILDVLEDIQHSGMSIIEICSFPDHLDYHNMDLVRKVSKQIQDMGLEPLSFHAPFADDIDITSPNEEQWKFSLNEILQAAQAAMELHAAYFVIHPGPEREGRPPQEEHFQRLEKASQALNIVAQYCREHNSFLMLENMLPHLLFGHTSDILYLLGAMEETDVGICLDTGHAFLSGDLYSVMYKLSGHLGMIHAADNNGNRDDHLPPGKGRIDWRTLVEKLMHVQFSGTFILELSGDTGEDRAAILDSARHARHVIYEHARTIERKKDFVF